MNTNTTIDRITTQDRSVYEAILNQMNTLNDGDSITIDDLTERVSSEVDMKTPALRAFVQHFARNVEPDGIGYVSNGRQGGFRKGTRPVKTTKTKKSKTAAATETE